MRSAEVASRHPATSWSIVLSPAVKLAAALSLLAAVYLTIGLLGDARAYSGSDAGGKLATVQTMAERGSWTPDIGYWAERWDPQGRFHPLIYTEHRESGWIQVTSLPMVYAAVSLWNLGGHNLVLLLPVVGSLLAALGAGRVARAAGAASPWPAFWAVGLSSSVVFYATDFWEHAPAVGLFMVGLALALERPAVGKALAAGLLVGAAAALRNEMVLYAVAIGVAVLAHRAERQWWLQRPRVVGGLVVGAVVPLVGNWLLERAVLGSSVRYSRVATNVADVGSEAPSRLTDALVTTFAVLPADSSRSIFFGLLVVLMAGLVVLWLLRGDSVARVGLVGAAGLIALVLARLGQGLGFVPGFLPAVPLAVLGVAALRHGAPGRSRLLLLGGLAALPAVWLLQWRGQLVPQWGGRYVLLSAVLLLVAGLVAMPADGVRSRALAVLVVASLLLTGLGAAWHVRRSAAVADAAAVLDGLPPDTVVVLGLSHLGREWGERYGDRPMLRLPPGADLAQLRSEVLGPAGVERFAFIDIDRRAARDPASVEGYRASGDSGFTFIGVPMRMLLFERR